MVKHYTRAQNDSIADAARVAIHNATLQRFAMKFQPPELHLKLRKQASCTYFIAMGISKIKIEHEPSAHSESSANRNE
jgi:hypothetical protein